MKFFTTLSSLAIYLIACSGNATEIPGGPISGHWFASGNPYNINGEIYVPAESILTIHQGVEVIFQGHHKFIVYGFLEAVGTEQDSILFTAADTIEGWHGIRFVDAPDGSYLSYCIIQYGRGTGSWWDRRGGGIYCDESHPVIHHSTIRWNSADEGGGIFTEWWASPIISRCTITGNSAENHGGGIVCGYGSPTIENCIISNNSSLTYDGAGGGICCFAGSPNISYCTLSGNWANDNGGGIWCDDYSYPTISHCTFNNNESNYYGGGIYCENNSVPTINHCTISGSSAYYNGGGIHCTSSSAIISHCTISGNSSNYYGGGVYCYLGSTGTILINCILWDNNSEQLYGNPQVTYSDIQGGWTGTGIIDADPLFVDAAGGDFHLQGGSPCIDAGDPDPIYNDPDGTRADMGAYHYHHGFQICPSLLDFGLGVIGFPTDLPLTLTNVNDSTLILYDFIPSDPSFYTDFNPADSLLLPGDSLVVTVTFSPLTIATYEETLTIVNSNEDWPMMLLGTGLESGTVIEGGAVSGTWEASGSPYWINGEITVPAGETLTIEPGLEVGFIGHFKLVVHGFLEAVGTETDPITFTAPDTAEGWHGIRFIDAPDSSHLSFCVLQYGQATGSGPDNSGGGIYCQSSNPEISRCSISRNSAGDKGGGIYCAYSDATILNCTISANSADSSGGGIYCDHSNPIINHCTIIENSSEYNGGGVFCVYSDATILNCTISGNSASEWGSHGGGIYCENSNPTISHCIISENDTWEYGGGIFCKSYSDVTIENCTVSGNSVSYYGGGISCYENSSATIENCTISENSAEYGGGVTVAYNCSDVIVKYCTISRNSANYGGGICCYENSDVTVENCTIKENSATYRAGGIYCSDYSDATIENCTISGNSTNWYGGGIYCDDDSEPSIQNCSVSMNSAGGCGSGIHLEDCNPTILNTIVAGNIGGAGGIYFENCPVVNVSYGDFYNNQNRNFAGQVPAGLGRLVALNANGDSCDVYYNICLDPLFIYPGQSDFRLQWDSPCIDAGDPDPVYNDPDGTVSDMGAFFYDQSMVQRILLTPHNAPIRIPAQGGSFDYTIWLTNIDPTMPQVQVWCDATLPDGSVFGPLLGPVSTILDSGQTISRERTQNVPSGAPAGGYSYNAYAVAGTDTSTDSFAFVKLGADGSDWLSGWINTGESFDDLTSTLNDVVIPESYSLEQNYPNPFNPITTITYALPKASRVILAVYDVSGRRVVVLVNGWRDAGFHDITFDGSNLASGVYIYRMQAGKYTAAGKMVLMK